MLLSAEKPVRVYRGATVVDGTGAERYVADVAVEGSRIVAAVSYTHLTLPTTPYV